MIKRQFRFMLILAIVAGFAGGAVANTFFNIQFVFAKKKPQHEKVISAEKFELMDKDGKVVGILGYWIDGPALLLSNKEIEPGTPRIILKVTKLGWSGLTLYGYEGKTSYTANMAPNCISVSAYRKGNMETGSLEAELEGKSGLFLYDKDFNTRVAIGGIDLKHPRTGVIEKRPISSLAIFDEDGKAIWTVP